MSITYGDLAALSEYTDTRAYFIAQHLTRIGSNLPCPPWCANGACSWRLTPPEEADKSMDFVHQAMSDEGLTYDEAAARIVVHPVEPHRALHRLHRVNITRELPGGDLLTVQCTAEEHADMDQTGSTLDAVELGIVNPDLEEAMMNGCLTTSYLRELAAGLTLAAETIDAHGVS